MKLLLIHYLWEIKADAKENLKVSYEFTEEQAEADPTTLPFDQYRRGCLAGRRSRIAWVPCLQLSRWWTGVCTVSHEEELREVKFATPRLSTLEDTAKTIEIDTASLIAEEDATSGRLYQAYQSTFFCSITLEEIGKHWWWPSDLCANCQDNPAPLDVHNS